MHHVSIAQNKDKGNIYVIMIKTIAHTLEKYTQNMSTENIFKTEQLVIVTSKIAIDHLEWRKYMLQNWSKLMRPKSKCLVLAGIHGNPDGSLL